MFSRTQLSCLTGNVMLLRRAKPRCAASAPCQTLLMSCSNSTNNGCVEDCSPVQFRIQHQCISGIGNVWVDAVEHLSSSPDHLELLCSVGLRIERQAAKTGKCTFTVLIVAFRKGLSQDFLQTACRNDHHDDPSTRMACWFLQAEAALPTPTVLYARIMLQQSHKAANRHSHANGWRRVKFLAGSTSLQAKHIWTRIVSELLNSLLPSSLLHCEARYAG